MHEARALLLRLREAGIAGPAICCYVAAMLRMWGILVLKQKLATQQQTFFFFKK